MNARSFASLFGKFALGLLVVPLLASAQNLSTSDDQDVDPPGRVARVNLIEGSAALRPVGADAWVDDVLNRPLGSGDQLWVESDSRAELHVGSTSVRLGARSGLAIVYVDDDQTQLRLNAGAADIRVRELQADEHFEVQTPDYTIAIRTPGDYRVDVNDEGNLTLLSVRSGSAEVSRGNQFYRVAAGQRGAFDSNGGGSAEIAGLPAPDALDRWSDERDGREDDSQAARYVSRDVIGYESLDGYGTWAAEPEYGNVWIPTVAVGWTPFYYGHWVYIAPWGWTWIDDAPWGFAPCHYGRWVHLPRNGGRWAWVPGPRRVERPMYAPALVAWMGNPGPGRVGWMPLGYRDVYVPPYRVSDRYARRVNLANAPVTAAVVDDIYRNPGARQRRYAHEGVVGAVVTVNRDTFESARSVQRGAQRPPVRDIQASFGAGVGPGRPGSAAALPPPTQRSFGRAAAQPRDVSAPVQRAVEQQRSVARPGAPAMNPGTSVVNPGARGQAAQPSKQDAAAAVRGRDRDERNRQGGGDSRNGGSVQQPVQPAQQGVVPSPDQARDADRGINVPRSTPERVQRPQQQQAEQQPVQQQPVQQQREEQQRQQQRQQQAQQENIQRQQEQMQRQQQAQQQAQQRQQQAQQRQPVQREREEKKKKDDHDRE